MSSHTEEEDDIETIREAFDIFDKNKNGSICKEELGSCLRALGENPTQREIEFFIKTCDKNKNNLIEFEDFVNLIKIIRRDVSRKEDEEKTLRRAFQIFDKDGNGLIDKSELERITTTLGESLSQDELEAMFRILDINKDGKIDYNEYIRYVTKPSMKDPIGHKKKHHHKHHKHNN